MPQPKQLYLEFVRGTVAILVFIAHTIELLPPISNAPDRFMINYVGTDSVMIFFLLSGCVINISQTRKPKSQKEFFVNRIIRLYPQFFTGVLLALIVIFVLKMPTPSLGNIFGNFFMFSTIQGYITTCFRTNLPVWTLTFEMFFYIMFLVCIGSNTKRKIWIWFFLSLLMMPLYYLKLGNNFERHFIFIIVFSSIWVVGYFIYAYRKYFYADTYTALFSFALLPIISRLHIFNLAYDPFNYLLFALMAAPFFRFSLQEKPEGVKIKIGYIIVAYIGLSILLFLHHDAGKVSSKIIYTVLPCAIVFFYFLIKTLNLKEKFINQVNKIGAVTGKYSYSLYIIHYPILYFLASVIKNKIVYVITSILIVTVACYILESVFQPAVVRIFKKKSVLSPQLALFTAAPKTK